MIDKEWTNSVSDDVRVSIGVIVDATVDDNEIISRCELVVLSLKGDRYSSKDL